MRLALISLLLAGCGGSAKRVSEGHATMTDVHVGTSSVDFSFDSRVQKVAAAYAQGPIAECGSGAPVRPRGAAVLVVHFLPAQTRGLPKRIVMPSGTVRELWKMCDFEADVGWASPSPGLGPSTFPETGRRSQSPSVAELDGIWDVRRVGGALPPLSGVRKRIRGTTGETVVYRGRGIPFDVSGTELRYRAPFAFLVDVLEPRGDGFHGRATAFGRVYGEFELRRSPVADIQTQLVTHIDEAHALEQTVLRMLDGLIRGADDPEIIDRLEHHKLETQQHESLMRGRLDAHGAQPSMVRQAAGMLEAFLKMPLDLVRGESTGRSARDAYTTEHLEIASYELLRRVAERAGDEETARACRDILEQERAMATFIEENWDRFAERSLREAGIPTG